MFYVKIGRREKGALESHKDEIGRVENGGFECPNGITKLVWINTMSAADTVAIIARPLVVVQEFMVM